MWALYLVSLITVTNWIALLLYLLQVKKGYHINMYKSMYCYNVYLHTKHNITGAYTIY